MQDTPVPSFFTALSAPERAALFTDARLRTLQAAFASIPDPRNRRGQRYDLPFLLICLVAALLCDCNSLEAVGRWTRDQRTVLARVCGPRRHLTPTGLLYRRLLPRLSAAHIERALACWVQQTRPLRDREPLALDGKVVRGARTATQTAPQLLSVSTHMTQETLVQVRITDKTNEIPVAQELLPHLALRGASSPPTPCIPKPPWPSASSTTAAPTCSRSRTISPACTPNWWPTSPGAP